MTTYPLPTLACTVDANGITAPDFNDILESLKASYRSIYGSDVYLEPDSQDGQWIAINATAINDANAAAIAVYNQFSPSTAVGNGLSSIVKTNGINRRVATKSTVDVTLVGQNGTVITNGAVGDTLGNTWLLPASVTIPSAGTITVTATCSVDGDLTAAVGTVTRILTPTRGWQTVTNGSAAAPGVAVETDGQLRQRQSISAALPALTALQGVRAAVGALTGVQDVAAFENDTNVTDSNGLPPHSMSMVVQGGDVTEIAETIALKKTPGTYTHGTTSEVVYDEQGMPLTIRFYRPTVVRVIGELTITALPGWQAPTAVDIVAAIVAAINDDAIGADVYLSKLYTPANLPDDPRGVTYDIPAVGGLKLARFGNAPVEANLLLAFNEVASADAADFVVTVV